MSSVAPTQGSGKTDDEQTNTPAPKQESPEDRHGRLQDFMSSSSGVVMAAGRETDRSDGEAATVASGVATMARVDNAPAGTGGAAQDQPTNDHDPHAQRREEDLCGVGTKF